MPYGILKVDTITFTDAGVDKSVAISGLVQNPTFTGNVTATGTISGLIVQAPTVTGTTANFASGVYTTQISGAIVKVPAGTASAPSIQVGVGASVAPGLYGAGTDLLGISTGGAGRIFIDSTGRLGVGTSSPQHPLQINAAIAQIRLEESSAGAKRLELWIDSSGVANIAANQSAQNIAFQTTGSERLRIDSSGRVGIGTSSPYGQFAVVGEDSNGVIASFDAGTNYQSFMLLGTTDAGNGTIAIQPRTVPGSGVADFYTYFKTITAGAGTTRHNVIIDGSVGIGTSSPGSLLDVRFPTSPTTNNGAGVNTLRVWTSSALAADTGGAISLGGVSAPAGGATSFGQIAGRKVNAISADYAGYLQFSVNNSVGAMFEAMRIDDQRRVGIGTSSPGSLLHVNGAITAGGDGSAVGIYLGTSGSAIRSLGSGSTTYIDLATGSASHGQLIVRSSNAYNERFCLDSSGRVGIGTSSPVSGLDLAGAVPVFTLKSSTNTGSGTPIISSIESYSSAYGLTNAKISFLQGTSGFSDLGCIALYSKGFDGLNERLRIDSSGNVGIGTTSLAAKLTVYGDGTSSDTIDVVNPSATNGATIRFADVNSSSAIKTIPAAGTHSLGFFVANSTVERMRIDSSGRLLVGTSTAFGSGVNDSNYSLIQIRGNTAGGGSEGRLTLGNTTASASIVAGNDLGSIWFTDGSGGDYARILAEADGAGGSSDYPGRLVFSTTSDGASSPTERMRIESNGNTRFSNLATIYPTTDNATTNGGSGFRWSAIWAANGTIQTSDERAKTDVSDAELGFNFIKSLRPVSYKWVEGGKVDTGERDDDGNYIYQSIPGERTHWGFIAQEVKEAVDDAGVDFGGWILTDKDDPNSQQALRYDQFIAPLTKALQEAIAKIETLEAKVAALEGN